LARMTKIRFAKAEIQQREALLKDQPLEREVQKEVTHRMQGLHFKKVSLALQNQSMSVINPISLNLETKKVTKMKINRRKPIHHLTWVKLVLVLSRRKI